MKNEKIWKTALYIRLSQEDKDNDELKQESNSITSQKIILKQYVEEHYELLTYDTYIDDGFTGTDFNRPGFQRFLADMKAGKVDCIIVKDLSRLGRNYIEVGNYIEQVFPLFNIRFISINDNIDSYENPSSINTIIVPFKNLINDEYARDTSIKIRSSLNSKKKRGEFIGAFTSYGYIKDKNDKHKLVVDKEAAEIVKKIFEWKVNEGLGNITISHKLNELGILNPTGYKRIVLRQNYKNNGLTINSYNWTPSTIRNILKNEVYIGNTVQGKRKSISYKIHKVDNVPENKWVRVENTHEAIIDKSMFIKANNLLKQNIKTSCKTKKTSIWAGIIKCADCKMAMNKKSSTNKNGKKYEYYICSTYRKKSDKLCTKHTIKVENLYNKVLIEVNNNIQNSKTIENKIKKIIRGKDTSMEKHFFIAKKIKEYQKEIMRKEKLKMELYEDLKKNILSEDEYIDYKKKYKSDIEQIKDKIQILKKEEEQFKKEEERINVNINKFEKSKQISELNRQIVLELIKTIYVYESGDIAIIFKE